MTRSRKVCPALALYLALACAHGRQDPPSSPGEPGGDPGGPGGDPDDPGGDPGGGAGGGRVIAYFPAWGVYARDYHVSEIPADLLTHVNYGFANLSAEGEILLGDPYADIDKFYPGDSWDAGSLRGSFHQLQLLKAAHPNLRTLISVGGWSWSGRFSDVAASETSRRRFAASSAEFVSRYGFDGVDIDWEYPGGGGLPGNTARPEDPANYVLLLVAVRHELDAQGARDGKRYLLTIAAPAAPLLLSRLLLKEMHPLLDWLNLMTYDFHGGWEVRTNFNAPLATNPADPGGDQGLDVASAVSAYAARGVPRAKLVVGMPFYGRGWAGVPDVDRGLYQSSSSLPPGTWEAGVFDYHDLVARYIPNMTRHFDPIARVPWLYDPARGLFISYEDPESIADKADFVVREGLGGGMVWELSSDTGEAALLATLHARVAPPGR